MTVLSSTNGPLDYFWEVMHKDNVIAQANGLMSVLFLCRPFQMILLQSTPDILI